MFVNELIKSVVSLVVITATGYGLYKGVGALETKLEQRKLRKLRKLRKEADAYEEDEAEANANA